ncbi:hypothetical protein COU74_04275 [Candidatus Peregrinibacteria bacterium CG10_big_fil_rev_8_21_14_0_10_36_19]|nr:MAG: hypothetical protein COU74_04275 [Candidatus Peregrinibacteria bacterium CG10_big_fil_rev_8_21_14_0_10_36_19]
MINDDNSPIGDDENQGLGDDSQKSAEDSAAEMWNQINQQNAEAEVADPAKKRKRKRKKRDSDIVPPSPFDEGDVVVDDEEDDDFVDEDFETKAAEVEPEAVEPEVVESEIVESEVVDVKTEDDEPVEDLMADFKEDFWDILRQAGIGKGHFIGIVVFFLLVIVGLAVFLFGVGDVGSSIDKTVVVDTPKVEKNDDRVDYDDNGDNVYGTDGLVSSYVFGLEFTNPLSPIVAEPLDAFANLKGVDVGLLVGGPLSNKTQFGAYVSLLRQLQQIYDTDVYEFLDLSTNRRKSLEQYLQNMNKIIVQGDAAYNEINLSMDSIEAEFNLLEDEKVVRETQFFNLAQDLYGDTAYDQLQAFVDLSQKASKLKADFNAYKLLAEMYLNSLNALKPRYEDITLNQEAVIKGVRVFDVPDSDINAIIRLNP